MAESISSMVEPKGLNGSGLPLEVTQVIDYYPAFNNPKL